MPKLLIFASGTKDGGGSGFQILVEASRTGTLKAEIVAVVSNHENGGVRHKADSLGIPFEYFEKPDQNKSRYAELVKKYGADFVALSGWLKKAEGLDPRTTINIHPGLLPEFGGPGMYGHYVHDAVVKAYKEGRATKTGVTMHFVTGEYDRGPIFFEYPVTIQPGDTAESLGKRVNQAEHEWQPVITHLVVNGYISWDGKDPKSLNVPDPYNFLPKSR